MNETKSKSVHLFWLRVVFSIALVGTLISLIVQPEFWVTLTNHFTTLPVGIAISLVFLLIIARVIQVFILRHALIIFGVRISLWDCTQLTGLKALYNLSITGGGIAAQLAQAKFSLGISARRFVASAFLQTLQFIGLLILLFGLALIAFKVAPFSYELAIGGVCIVIGLGAVLLVPQVLGTDTRVLQALPSCIASRLEAYMPPERPTSLALWRILFLFLALHTVRTLRLVGLLAWMKADIPVAFSLTAVLGSDVLAQLPITPGGIGTRELSLGYFGSQNGLFHLFLSAAIIDRSFAIAFNIGHGLFAFFTLSNGSSSKPLS